MGDKNTVKLEFTGRHTLSQLCNHWLNHPIYLRVFFHNVQLILLRTFSAFNMLMYLIWFISHWCVHELMENKTKQRTRMKYLRVSCKLQLHSGNVTCRNNYLLFIMSKVWLHFFTLAMDDNDFPNHEIYIVSLNIYHNCIEKHLLSCIVNGVGCNFSRFIHFLR